MEQVMMFATILCPIVVALVELVKRTVPHAPKNILPMTSVVLGLVVGAVAYPFADMDLVLRLWAGGLSGLAATGLFELGKKAVGK